MSIRSRYSSIALFAVALGGCPHAPAGMDAGDVIGGDAIADATEAAAPSVVVRFRRGVAGARPAPLEIPFPSDVYLDPDGTIADDLRDFTRLQIYHGTDALAAAYAPLDGFARMGGAIFLVDAVGTNAPLDTTIDPTSLPSVASDSLGPNPAAFIVDLDADPTSPSARVPAVAGWQGRFRTIVVQPDGRPLRAGGHYAFGLTSRVRTTVAGVTVAASPDFVAIRDNATGARGDALGTLYGNAVDAIVARMPPGFDPHQIIALSVLTTQTRSHQLRPAAAAIRAGGVVPVPTLNTDATVALPYTVARFGAAAHAGWTATLDAWFGTPRIVSGYALPGFPDPVAEGPGLGVSHDALGAVFTGTFVVPDYRGADGSIALNADGSPIVVNANQHIPVTFALPLAPAPATGYPVVIFGHGLGNHRRQMFAIANELARVGIATVAIDTVTFGQRAYPPDTLSLEAGTYQGPDGIGDMPEYMPAPFFGSLQSLIVFRDNLREAGLDLVQLRRLIANPALDLSFVADQYGGTAPTLDATHIAYVGDSLGGLVGTIFAAIEPGVDPFVLNVPGGGIFTAIASDAPIIGQLVATVPALVFGAPSDAPGDRFHPIYNLLQIGIEPADPLCFAADVTHPPDGAPPHDVWMVESLWDEIMSNRSTELLAREMNLTQITPLATAVDGLAQMPGPLAANLPGGAVGGFFQMVPSTHGANIASRFGVRTYVPPFPAAGPVRFPLLAQPYRVRQPIVPYQHAIAAFLRASFGGAPAIDVRGLDPLYDMDDDGWTDDEERAAGTDPYDPNAHPAGAPPHVRNVGF